MEFGHDLDNTGKIPEMGGLRHVGGIAHGHIISQLQTMLSAGKTSCGPCGFRELVTRQDSSSEREIGSDRRMTTE